MAGSYKKLPKHARAKFNKVMHEYGTGKLISSGDKKKVTDQKQAVAIAFSEARRYG